VSLAPFERVRDTILNCCSPLPPVTLPLADALGAVAATHVTAPFDVPPFPNTAMDGYAVRAEDTVGAPVRLSVVGTLPAGVAPSRPVNAGEAMRIMTGAPMPEGADAVVMVELTQSLDRGSGVLVQATAKPGQFVRRPGDDLRAGQEVVAAGTVLRPAHLGLLASVGHHTASVHRRPVVGALSTGDEVVIDPRPLLPGQIYDANRPMLLALVLQAGAVPLDLGHASDDPDALVAAVRNGLAAGCDAIILTGGVSVGDFDHVEEVFERLGQTWSWQVAIKPGKPLAFAVSDDKLLFGLPGNPVSSAVSFEAFARPALRRLLGDPHPSRPTRRAVAAEGLRRPTDGKLHLVRVVATPTGDGRLAVRSAGTQASHVLGALAAANALALIPDGDGVQPGETVDIWLLDDR
jgi:molybdopterin molybdotransferase